MRKLDFTPIITSTFLHGLAPNNVTDLRNAASTTSVQSISNTRYCNLKLSMMRSVTRLFRLLLGTDIIVLLTDVILRRYCES